MVSTGKKIGYGVGGLIVVAGGAWAILANQSNNNSSSTAKVASAGSFKGDYKNAKTAVKNGSLTVTTPGTASSPISFGGYLEFTQWSAAASQLGPASNSIFYSDSKNRLENGGPANFKIDKDKKTVTITLRKDLKWSDGKQVVARDVAFSLETLATNEVATSNFSTAYTNIKGVTDFQNGKAYVGIPSPHAKAAGNEVYEIVNFLPFSPSLYLIPEIESALPFWKSVTPLIFV